MARDEVIFLKERGIDVLSCSLINKGTAFSSEERDDLGLHGLLPPKVSTLEEQIKRSYYLYSKAKTPLEKYGLLMKILRRSELLFYQFVFRYVKEMLPLIYTPTVGDAAMEYSQTYFYQRGLYVSYLLKDRMDELFQNYKFNDVEVVVVTDGERVLGLGDQGIGGMTISVGKLALYTLFGGIHPAKTLPIVLDVGTNNEQLKKDELYLGLNQDRISEEAYDLFIASFVKAVKNRYPKALIQWEDFGKKNARKNLERYRDEVLSFNDDIQGTAAVTLGAIYSGIKIKKESLKDQKIVILGAGSAGTGIADMLLLALQDEGLSFEEAKKKIFLLDRKGLIYFGSKEVSDSQKNFIQSQENLKDWDLSSSYISLFDVVRNAHPTVLIGVAASPGAFDKGVIEEMGKHVSRPIVLPLSNPTSKIECSPEDAIEWTKGRAIIATGSPFPDVNFGGKVYKIAQCNNIYIFPGLGLGALAVGAKKVTDAMFLEAARTLAEYTSETRLLPEVETLRDLSKEVAIRVGKKACLEKVASCKESDVKRLVEEKIWTPSYPQYKAE